MPSVGRSRSMRFIAGSVAALCVLAGSGCGAGGERASDASLPSTRGYLIVSLDTLRADHLSLYGYERETSPFLDRLAGSGVVFENAIAQYPSTLTSHMSLFTGLYPGEHGVLPPDHSLSPDLDTLPELFQRAGYRTAGFTEGGMMEGRYGFDRGFDLFSDEVDKGPRDLETVLDRGRAFLAELGETERFFLLLHTYSVHAPYTPPDPYGESFWSGEPPRNVPEPTARNLRRMMRFDPLRARPAIPYYVSQYDGTITYVDDLLEAFFGELEASGLLAETTVILLSDHGEEFLEHGELAHGQIYDETMRVPLVVLHPEATAPRRVDALVELIDVSATLYDLAGLDPDHDVRGTSLVPWLAGEEVGDQVAAFGQVGPSRTLYRWEGDRLLQMVVSTHPEGQWFRKRIAFDLPPGTEGFSIRSYEEPRRVSVRVGGGRARRQWIGTEWERLTVASSERDEPIRVSVSTPTCTPVRTQRLRCWSFQIRDPNPRKVELFDLTSDRDARTDISTEEGELTRRLLRRLGEYRFEVIAEPIVEAPDEELLERLRALGYVD